MPPLRRNEGKAAIADAKELFFKNKSKKGNKRNHSDNEESSTNGQSSNKRSKQSARIAALEKTVADQAAKLDEQSKLAEIASTIKASKSGTPTDQLSLARSVMSIASRQQDS